MLRTCLLLVCATWQLGAAQGLVLARQRRRALALLWALAMPVLFITGDEGWVFPPAAGPALAALAPKGRAVRVPAAGHSVYFERAAQFNQLVESVL